MHSRKLASPARSRRLVAPAALLLAACCPLWSSASLNAQVAQTAAEPRDFGLAGARTPEEGLLFGGQPTPEQLAAAAAAGYRVVDLRAAYQLRENLELYGRLENAFDEEYETIARYGTPGRGFFVGVRQSF